MGARSGGGGGGRGGSTVFRGGFNAERGEVSNIVINSIDRVTEKAIQVSTAVNWAKGGAKHKQIWVPKSTVVSVTKSNNGQMMLNMSKSMASSISKNNSYKGYLMEFTFSHNT